MHKLHLLSLLLVFSIKNYTQEISKDKMADIINRYKSEIEGFSTISDCGHVIDGFTYIGKQTENVFLDAVLVVSGDSRKEIGDEIYQKLILEGEIVSNHSALPKVTAIFNRLIQYTSTPDATYKISILHAEEINAYTTIGGYFYITDSLLNFVESDDELAFVIAHEIAHEDRLHTQRRLTKITLTADLLNMTQLESFTAIALNLNDSLGAPFDQIDEYEADKYGFLYASKAGYDTAKFGDFFEKLEKIQNPNLFEKLTSTHPFAVDRLNCLLEYSKN